jgi:hypothetical protein
MKDPACLFYIDTWLSATAEMDSDVRGWYLNLILHQYDKKDLPNDLEKLAVLAGVKFSEFERFKQMFEQVLKHKFELNESNRLENNYAKSILTNREQFKDKRQKSGNIGVVIKLAKSIEGFNDFYIDKLKIHLFSLEKEQIDKHKDKQVLQQMLKLYINENKDIDINTNKHEIFKNECLQSQQFLEAVAMKEKIPLDKMQFALIDFNNHLITVGEIKSDLKDYKYHFTSWVRKMKEIKQKEQQQKNKDRL